LLFSGAASLVRHSRCLCLSKKLLVRLRRTAGYYSRCSREPCESAHSPTSFKNRGGTTCIRQGGSFELLVQNVSGTAPSFWGKERELPVCAFSAGFQDSDNLAFSSRSFRERRSGRFRLQKTEKLAHAPSVEQGSIRLLKSNVVRPAHKPYNASRRRRWGFVPEPPFSKAITRRAASFRPPASS
jgi:hypothetical protein